MDIFENVLSLSIACGFITTVGLYLCLPRRTINDIWDALIFILGMTIWFGIFWLGWLAFYSWPFIR